MGNRSALQSHSALLSDNLQALSQQLAEQQHLFSALAVYPLPQFPNHQNHILEQMLRTKLEPDVKEWVDQGEQEAGSSTAPGTLSEQDRNELWEWAPSAAQTEARKEKWGADYTLAEKETGIDQVVTGLNRVLIEPPDGPEEEEEEYEEVTDEEEDENEDEEEKDKMELVETPAKAGPAGNEASVSKATTPPMPLNSIHKFMITGKIA